MGDIGGTKIDEFEGIGFKHETEKFLVRFSLGYNWFSIEAFVKEDFIWWQVPKTGVAQDETIATVADVSNEKMVVFEDGLEVD